MSRRIRPGKNDMGMEWHKHWDTVCTSILAIGTAALGAVVVLSGISDTPLPGTSAETETPNPADQLKVIVTGLATGAYLILALAAGLVIFVFTSNTGFHSFGKIMAARTVYVCFIVEVLSLAALLWITLQ